jgi:hypothetical protein
MSSAPLPGIRMPGGRTLTDDHDGRPSLAQWTLTRPAACKFLLPAARTTGFRPAACYLVRHTPAEIVAHYFCGSARRGTLVRLPAATPDAWLRKFSGRLERRRLAPERVEIPVLGSGLCLAGSYLSARAVTSRCNECCDTRWQRCRDHWQGYSSRPPGIATGVPGYAILLLVQGQGPARTGRHAPACRRACGGRSLPPTAQA